MKHMEKVLARARAEFTALNQAVKQNISVKLQPDGVVKVHDGRTGVNYHLTAQEYYDFVGKVVQWHTQ